MSHRGRLTFSNGSMRVGWTVGSVGSLIGAPRAAAAAAVRFGVVVPAATVLVVAVAVDLAVVAAVDESWSPPRGWAAIAWLENGRCGRVAGTGACACGLSNGIAHNAEAVEVEAAEAVEAEIEIEAVERDEADRCANAAA